MKAARWYYVPGFALAWTGIMLCAIAGVQDDWHKIYVPGAQAGLVALMAGIILLIIAVGLDCVSRVELTRQVR